MAPEHLKRFEKEEIEKKGKKYKEAINQLDDITIANMINDLCDTLYKIKNDACLRYEMFGQVEKQLVRLEEIRKSETPI